MEIILIEKVQNLGDIGDLVAVKNGYARNFLIPHKKAMLATAEAKIAVEQRRKELAAEEQTRFAQATARADKATREIQLTRLCGEEGQLYGSVSPVDIAEAMSEAGTAIEKSEIAQPDGPIKHVGEFEADVILHAEVRFTVKIKVDGELSDGSEMDESARLRDDPQQSEYADTEAAQEAAK